MCCSCEDQELKNELKASKTAAAAEDATIPDQCSDSNDMQLNRSLSLVSSKSVANLASGLAGA